MVNKILNKFGYQLIRTKIENDSIPVKDNEEGEDKPTFLKADDNGKLYKCRHDINLYLDESSYVESKILENNIWEKESVLLCESLIRPGDIILDVGANFGYYSLLFAYLTGSNGAVYASEPTKHFRKKLNDHLRENNYQNIKVLDFGFSNEECELEIKIDSSTASMHMPSQDSYLLKETISLKKLDDVVSTLNISKIDFIKIDIDGHEPLMLKGAENTIRSMQPKILLEVNPLNYYLAGITIWDFYDQIKGYGYKIYHEKTKEEIKSKVDFLKRCGNFGWQLNWKAPFSSNVLLAISNPFDEH